MTTGEPNFIRTQTYGYTYEGPSPYALLDHEFDALYFKMGKPPDRVILGWGTYLGLCMEYARYTTGHYGQIVWLSVWNNASIIVDPSREHVVVFAYKDPQEVAMHAALKAHMEANETND